jgi:hypothetical protein
MDLFEPYDMDKWCERGFRSLEEAMGKRPRPG